MAKNKHIGSPFLLDCPFCGGEAIDDTRYDDFRFIFYCCKECNAHPDDTFALDYENRDLAWEAAAKAWNTRVADTLPGGPQWIPISERLPEDDVMVLVYEPDRAIAHIAEARHDDYGWSNSCGTLFPTHWQNLPDHPKGEE